ncbi:hypothetical protein SARC_07489, partial [Sphaeroforma arctica JP610]
MSQHAAALQAYNIDLAKGIVEIKDRRARVLREVAVEQAESDKLNGELALLT